jgi:hypothetical protein
MPEMASINLKLSTPMSGPRIECRRLAV